MNRLSRLMIAAALLVAAPVAFAQDVPYEQAHRVGGMMNQGGARLIFPARLHREVEVSRSLAAQPVHPHLAYIQIGGGSEDLTAPRGGGALTTYIDPMRQLDGDEGLEENHSFIKAQRLHRSLSGVTTEQLAALTSAALAAQPRGVGSNRARLIANPHAHGFKPIDRIQHQPVFILPAPGGDARPKAPRPRADDRLLAGDTD